MIFITERRTRPYIPVIRENNGISSTARHHRIGDWNLNLPEGLSERNGQPLISERIAWRAAHQLICQLGGRVAGWGCFDKIYRKFRICDVRSIPHSPTTQTIHSIVAMLDTLKLLRFCMKLVKFSKFTWVTRTFDLCGEFFFLEDTQKWTIDHHDFGGFRTLRLFLKFPPPHNLSKLPWMLARMTKKPCKTHIVRCLHSTIPQFQCKGSCHTLSFY